MKALISSQKELEAAKLLLELDILAEKDEDEWHRVNKVKSGYDYPKMIKHAIKKEIHSEFSSIFTKAQRRGLIENVGSNNHKRWRLVSRAVLEKSIDQFKPDSAQDGMFTTKSAAEEYDTITVPLIQEFETAIERYESRTGKLIKVIPDVKPLIEYMKHVLGDEYYLEGLLPLIQQYSLCDATIIKPDGKPFGTTRFNLAYFGYTSTGKTFSSIDLILGDEKSGIPAHGGYGLTRYAGGFTPSKFIQVAEAYKDWPVTIAVPEFNEWFKYDGMVEPLKLVMEGKIVEYGSTRGKVGPYKSEVSLLVNYNTSIKNHRSKVTITDPNFNAIEERTLLKMFENTDERTSWLRNNQKRLIKGDIIFSMAEDIRQHITLSVHNSRRVGLIDTSTSNTSINKKPTDMSINSHSREYIASDESSIEVFNTRRGASKIRTYQDIDTAVVLLSDDIIDMVFSRLGTMMDEYDISFSPRMPNRLIRMSASIACIRLLKEGSPVKIKKRDVRLALEFLKEEASARSSSGK